MLTIAFDDAYSDTCKYALGYLDKYGIKSTVSVPVNLIGSTFENRPLIGLRDLKRIAKSGHEIASHTLTHPNLARKEAKKRLAAHSEIAESKRKLERLLGRNVSSFVFPYIKKNQTRALCLKAKSYYKSVRVTFDKPCFNKLPVKSASPVKGFAVMKKHSLSYLNKQVDYAEENKLWLIEVFHLVGKKNTLSASRPKPYRFFMHISDFKKHIDYIMSKGVLVRTQGGGKFSSRDV